MISVNVCILLARKEDTLCSDTSAPYFISVLYLSGLQMPMQYSEINLLTVPKHSRLQSVEKRTHGDIGGLVVGSIGEYDCNWLIRKFISETAELAEKCYWKWKSRSKPRPSWSRCRRLFLLFVLNLLVLLLQILHSTWQCPLQADNTRWMVEVSYTVPLSISIWRGITFIFRDYRIYKLQ